MVTLPSNLHRALAELCRECGDRELVRLVKLGPKYSNAQCDELMERLNYLYWNRTDFRHVVKDALMKAYTTLQKIPRTQAQPAPAPGGQKSVRETLLEIKRQQELRRRNSNTESTMNLESELIKLGSTHPELQDHIRPVLDRLKGQAKTAAAPKDSLVGCIENYLYAVVNEVASLLKRTPGDFHTKGVFQEHEAWKFGVIQNRTDYLMDVEMRLKGTDLHVTSFLGSQKMNLVIPGNVSAKKAAMMIGRELGDMLF